MRKLSPSTSVATLLVATLLVAAVLVVACDSGNPVAPAMPEASETTSTSTYTIAMTATPASLNAGSGETSSIAVSVARVDNGQAPADGSELILSTDLGDFGTDASGSASQMVSLSLAGGSASTTLFAPEATGTATVLALFSDTTQQLAVSIVDAGDPPVASFTSKISDFIATFADTSTGNPTSWAWDFGDCGANPAACTSNEKNPVHVYQSAGDFVVTLTATNAGGSSSQSQIVTAPSGTEPVADFTIAVDAFRVTFTDVSTGNPSEWQWDFGDCTIQPDCTSSDRSPAHTYTAAGTYSVTLTVVNAAGTDSRSQFVTVPSNTPVAEFTFLVEDFAVTFTDASSGGPTAWSWDFGDGRGTSNERSPVYTYTAAGSYTASLTVSNDGGSDVRRQIVTVPSGDAPTAAFTFAVDGLQATFADASSGDPTGWSWNFGDGNSSTLQNPTHTYSVAGDYTVTLTATNDAGGSSASQIVTVPSGDAPMADFTFAVDAFQVTFVDASTGSPTSWSWNFGDGNSSTEQNPVHVYSTAGDYAVTLTVTNDAGSSGSNQIVTVPSGDLPAADFTFVVDGFQVTFADASTGNPSQWAWDFGDNTSSSAQNPSHDYTNAGAGTYTVSLTVTNTVGSNTSNQLVTVPSGEAPSSAFTFTVDNFLVTFADASAGSPTSWQWDFGDGRGSSDQNPVNDYGSAGAGTYTVSLTVSNAAGSSTSNQFVTVSAGDPPAADFSFDVVGCAVTFTDTSTGDPTQWNWNFGDGGTSTSQNPLHNYSGEDDFTVTLTVTNAAGSASRAKAVSVTDCP